MRFSNEDYSELLAMYLGDGCISEHPRTQRLRIVLDRKYPRIIADTRDLLARCLPANRVEQVRAPGCIHVALYSSHLGCCSHNMAPDQSMSVQSCWSDGRSSW
jgi:hypothetical protein